MSIWMFSCICAGTCSIALRTWTKVLQGSKLDRRFRHLESKREPFCDHRLKIYFISISRYMSRMGEQQAPQARKVTSEFSLKAR